MATPPRFPSLSPDQSLNTSGEVDAVELNHMDTDLEPGQEGFSSRPSSEITLIDPSPVHSISQIDGAGGLESTTRTVRFQLNEDDQPREQRAVWRRRIRAILEMVVKKFLFLSYFTSNAAMLIRIALAASKDQRMQLDEVLCWTFVQFLMLLVLLVRYVWMSIIASPIDLPDSMRIAAASAGTLFLSVALGMVPLFFI